jgi:hypothetical protein
MGLMGITSWHGTSTDVNLPISIPAQPFEGGWVLESLNVNSVETAVEPGVNSVRVPWIEIGTALGGNTGCNGFHGSPDGYSFTDGVLIPGEVTVRAVGCNSPVEEAFLGMLWNHPGGIDAEFTDGGMVWTAGDTRLVFTSAYAIAPHPDGPQMLMQNRLDCSPGTVARDSALDTGQDPEQLVSGASPDVVRVEIGSPSWWWGYSDIDQVVAGVTIGGIDPGSYTIYTCADLTP